MRNHTIIIAEAGVNHNGSMDLARQLIDIAAEAGADYVKFQTFKADKIASKSAVKAVYQQQTTDAGESQLQMLKKLELNEAAHQELIAYCRQRNIQFLSTPFDMGSIDLLRDLGIRLGKIPSGEITNLLYLRKMAVTFDELVLSTGMADMQEIGAALGVIIGEGFDREKITVLHCNTEYPTPFEDVNLRAMGSIAREFNVRVGYSDHTPGIEVPVAAVALGAVLIEKHFTIDRGMEGPDHKASLEPQELKQMIGSIRNIEKALGVTIKQPSPSEIKNKSIARKSIVAARRIRKGELFTEENLAVKRPGTGISPMRWNELLGKAATRDFDEDELIDLL
ncbi:MAG: N-acetylneuraminate synthase [Sphingobacteriales bacterium 50-39]|nr:N-acetylneuraminate synthase [Sphingobacteriales bacterium]OJW56834.1 MAG: N-acetylneuraminate synthase [Sphingobacteriales bacterium 50-39]